MNFTFLGLVSSVCLLGTGSCFTIKSDKPGNKTHIIGGNESNVIVPYHVYMECDGKYFCGGALISARHVLTAAHCIFFMLEKKCAVKVVAGTNSRRSGGFYVMAGTAQMHPAYSVDTNEHDIGVIKLRTPFLFTENIRPVGLTPYPPEDNELISVTGYGRINRNNSEMSETLKWYTSGLMRYEGCFNRADGRVHPSDLCDYGENNLGTCQGDSGSPVVNRRYLIAVVSRGVNFAKGANYVPDCTNGIPNIFTSVYYHLDFIYSCLLL